MRNNRKILVGLITAAVLAASSSLVYSHPMGGGPGYGNCEQGAGPDAQGFGPGAGRGGHGMWSNPAAAVEGYLAALKVELKITPDQDKAWQAFTAKAKQQADTMIARRTQMFGQASGSQSAPERLAQRTEFMKQGLASMESMTAAVKDLYGVLTPEQKTIADQQLTRGPMGGSGGHRFHR